jgi:hypothetical protein
MAMRREMRGVRLREKRTMSRKNDDGDVGERDRTDGEGISRDRSKAERKLPRWHNKTLEPGHPQAQQEQ